MCLQSKASPAGGAGGLRVLSWLLWLCPGSLACVVLLGNGAWLWGCSWIKQIGLKVVNVQLLFEVLCCCVATKESWICAVIES